MEKNPLENLTKEYMKKGKIRDTEANETINEENFEAPGTLKKREQSGLTQVKARELTIAQTRLSIIYYLNQISMAIEFSDMFKGRI